VIALVMRDTAAMLLTGIVLGSVLALLAGRCLARRVTVLISLKRVSRSL
jgi:hypothetical protein